MVISVDNLSIESIDLFNSHSLIVLAIEGTPTFRPWPFNGGLVCPVVIYVIVQGNGYHRASIVILY